MRPASPSPISPSTETATPSSPATLSPATLNSLELPSLLAVLSTYAATDLGRERTTGLLPAVDEDDLHRRRQRYAEVQRLQAVDGRLVPSSEDVYRDILDGLDAGRGQILGLHLVRLGNLLQTTQRACQRILDADPACEALAQWAQPLPDLSDLSRRLNRSLDRRGEVRDDASPELVRLRGQIRKVRDGLYQQLTSYVSEHRDLLSEDTIPMRGGRLVLTLQAGSRGRQPGLTHGRSGTGKSFYFEPLSVVEPNNQLQQAVEDEAAERQRILAQLLQDVRAVLPDLHQHADFLAELDLQQAAGRFAELCDGRQADLAGRHELCLRSARHPLLDPVFAAAREQVLGTSGHTGAVVPLDFEMTPRCTSLVVTGPNAGGKTVALKTVGLLAAATLCGLPIPAATGTRVPFLRALVATVGDDQDLLADRSTFSGRLLRLKEAWSAAGPDALLLLDELGSGTDPAEGAALGTSLLEGLLERQALTLITTHLTPVAAAAMELDGAGCAAMEMSAEGDPTFHLVPGPPGGSEAISLARRLGLPTAWLDRAEARLGEEHRDLRRLLAELEDLRHQVAEERDQLRQEREDADKLRRRLAEQESELRRERKRVGQRLQSELEDFRQHVRQRLGDEVEQLRGELEAGRRRGLEAKAVERLFEEAPQLHEPEPEPEGPLVVGSQVRHRRLGWRGRLESVDGDRAEVGVLGKRLRCSAGDLVPVAANVESAKTKVSGRPSQKVKKSNSRPGRDLEAMASGPPELNLIGQRVESALEQLDRYLDQALLGAAEEIRIVHGHGSGRLRRAVREHLRGHPAVATSRPGKGNEGGDGATVVSLRG